LLDPSTETFVGVKELIVVFPAPLLILFFLEDSLGSVAGVKSKG